MKNACIILIISLIAGSTYYFTREPEIIGCGNREKPYQKVQAFILAKSLAKAHTGNGNCLVIHHPISENGKKHLLPILDSFKEGLNGKIKEIRAVPIIAFPNEDAMLEEAMMEITAEDFNNIITANNDCDMVITMVPIPFSRDEVLKMNNFKMVKSEKEPSKYKKDPNGHYPTFGIYNGYIGNLEFLFEEKLIHAMAIWKPSPTIDEQPVPKDLQKAFDKRYLIVTPANIVEIKTKYPKLFPKPRKKH